MFVRVYRARARGFGRVRVFALPKRKEPPEGALCSNAGRSSPLSRCAGVVRRVSSRCGLAVESLCSF